VQHAISEPLLRSPDPDPDPDPHQSKRKDPDPCQSGMQNPDPHQRERIGSAACNTVRSTLHHTPIVFLLTAFYVTEFAEFGI
jgi:hypothetical protein